MFRRFLVALAIFGGSQGAQAQPLPDRLPLEGVVVDEENRPVSEALVSIRRQDDTATAAFWGGEVRAGKNGQFGFPLAEEGRYYLNFEAPGFAPGQNLALDWKAGSPRPRLQLQRLATLVLRFSRPDGSPLANESLFVRLRGEVAANFSQVLLRPRTDNNGLVRLNDLAPATYALWARAKSGFALRNALVVKGSNAPQPLEISIQQGASVSVAARDASGQSLGGAQLSLAPLDAAQAALLAGELAEPGEDYALLAAGNDRAALVTRDGVGTLVLDAIAPGKYRARLSLPGYGAAPSREVELRAGQNSALDWEFPARKGAVLGLRINDSAGQPLANAAISLRVLPIASDGTLRDETEELAPGEAPNLDFVTTGAAGRRVVTDSAGRAALYPLKPGRYRLFASRSRLANDWSEQTARESAARDVEIALAPGAEMVLVVP